MLLEMHTHTVRHSKCSVIDPVALVRHVVRKGLQGIILTEHCYLWTDEEIERLRAEAECERHFLIFAAQEVDTDFGHVLVYGADRSIETRTPLDALRARYPDSALVWAHPFRNGKIPSREEITSPCLDGIEIISLNQSAQENYRGLKEWHACKFTALSGSDTHSEDMAGVFPTHFDHQVSTMRDVVTEIKHGRCRPFLKEIPKAGADALVTEITIGTKGADEHRQRIIVRSIPDPAKWKKARESAGIVKAIYGAGFTDSTFRVPRIIEISANDHLLIEEGQRGKNLYDVLSTVTPGTGATYFELAAHWLSKLHHLKFRLTPLEETTGWERKRFDSYLRSFTETGNTHEKTARELVAFVQEQEEKLFDSAADSFVQCHGDYHPKNIIIGQDRMHDPGTLFISVIDFNNSVIFSPAFDVGYFLAQFKSQFADFPEVLASYSDEIFLKAYLTSFPQDEPAFRRQVDIFQIRANLSIASYLIRMGKGLSPELRSLVARSVSLQNTLSKIV